MSCATRDISTLATTPWCPWSAGGKLYDYRYAFNGFSAALTSEQVAAVKAIPGVFAVEETREIADGHGDDAGVPRIDRSGNRSVDEGLQRRGRHHRHARFRHLAGKSELQRPRGRSPRKGNLRIIIFPAGMASAPQKKTTDGSFDANQCNQKLIGAQYFCCGLRCDDVLPHEFLSPRDYNGHGTHTASTAGGNEGVVTTGALSAFRERQRYCAASANRCLQDLLGQRGRTLRRE